MRKFLQINFMSVIFFLFRKTGPFFLFFSMSACFYFTDPIRRAQKALGKGNCKQAKHFFLLADREGRREFAGKAAKACVSRFTAEAVFFYDYLFKQEKNMAKRVLIKEDLADVYFTNQQNYEKAIEEYFFLKGQDVSMKKKHLYSFRIALSYFEMGKWEMSLKETEKLVSMPLKKESLLETLFLSGRVLLMQEKYAEAGKLFKKIRQVDPVYFEENKLFLYLSFIYESRKEFHQAIIELGKFQNTSEFLADKIKRLKVRQSKQPGVTPL